MVLDKVLRLCASGAGSSITVLGLIGEEEETLAFEVGVVQSLSSVWIQEGGSTIVKLKEH
jgi:hypothetical protein